MPAKKRPAAADSAAAVPAVSSTPAPDAGSSSGLEVRAASPASPASKKPAGKRGAKPVAKPAAEAAVPPKRGAAKSKRIAPAAPADVVTDASEAHAAAVVADSPAAQRDTAVTRPRPTDDEIRQYAYFLSLRRNGRGDPIADWMEAERALRARTD